MKNIVEPKRKYAHISKVMSKADVFWKIFIGGIFISGNFPYQQNGIDAAKSKILYGCGFYRRLQNLLHMFNHGAALVNFFQINRWRDKSILHHINRKNSFNGAASGHGVPEVTL